MEKITVSEEQIRMIQDESFDANFWLYQLGMSISNEKLTSDNRFSFDLYNSGKQYWEHFLEKIKDVLCDRNSNTPKSSFDEFLSGDIRNLIVYLITVIVTDLGIVISVAIPIVSLILKKGIRDFCLTC
jgi:hypothetical protein